MKHIFIDGELNEDFIRKEFLRITGVYCQNKNIPIPETCKKVLDESTPEELAKTEINLINTEYLLEV